MNEVGWKPPHFVNNVSSSVGSVMKPAGFENGQDIISLYYLTRRMRMGGTIRE